MTRLTQSRIVATTTLDSACAVIIIFTIRVIILVVNPFRTPLPYQHQYTTQSTNSFEKLNLVAPFVPFLTIQAEKTTGRESVCGC
jgi:hypothetical protein